jgi:hypothetical protein
MMAISKLRRKIMGNRTTREALETARMMDALRVAGIDSVEDREALRRIAMTLHRWPAGIASGGRELTATSRGCAFAATSGTKALRPWPIRRPSRANGFGRPAGRAPESKGARALKNRLGRMKIRPAAKGMRDRNNSLKSSSPGVGAPGPRHRRLTRACEGTREHPR